LDRVRDTVRAELEALRQQFGFPGATAAFVMPDGRTGGVAVGLADLDTGDPMPADARMPAGSVGKTFVIGVIVSLLDEGVIDLDDPLSRWLGDEPWFPRLDGGEQMTLRHVLTHTSGLPRHVFDPRFLTALERFAGTDETLEPPEIVELIVDKELLSAPGERFSYTDSGYILAGLVIERATGSTYWSQLEQRVLDRFDLQRTRPADRRDIPGIVQGHLRPDNPLQMPERAIDGGLLVVNPAIEWTGGGVVSNSVDLARWAWLLWGGSAFGEGFLEELFDGTPLDPQAPAGDAYGLGVFVRQTELGRIYEHAGWYPGYTSVTAYLPQSRIAVAVQINSSADPNAIKEALIPIARAVFATLAPTDRRSRAPKDASPPPPPS
jgi:D-alanyl-D-alanine carboxypeptidase